MKFGVVKSIRDREQGVCSEQTKAPSGLLTPRTGDGQQAEQESNRAQSKRVREAMMSWLYKWIGSRGKRGPLSGELTSRGDREGGGSPASEMLGATKPRSSLVSTRSNSGSIGSFRGSTQSKRSGVSKSSTDYYSTGQNNRRSAIDLTAGARTGEPTAQMQNSASFLAVYTFFTTAHRGSHAKIIKARHRMTHERVVLKAYSKDSISPNQLENITKEIGILTTAKGAEGIVQLLGSYEDGTQALAVLEDCTGGTLIGHMANKGGRLCEASCVKNVVRPLLKALVWLHSRGIVIRDLKPDHIMFDNRGSLRLVDFFASAVMGEDALITREGTLAYMAPEMVGKPSPDEFFHELLENGLSETDFPQYTEKVDIWSLGVVIFEALTGRQPFLAESAEDLRRIQDQTLSSYGGVRSSLDSVKMREFMSTEALDFVERVLRINPDERPSALELLEHPWVVVLAKSNRVNAEQRNTDSFASARSTAWQ